MNFSDRIGATTPKSVIQLEDMDQDLRNSLWNYFFQNIWNKILLGASTENIRYQNIQFITSSIYKYLKIPIDEVPVHNHLCQNFFKRRFLEFEWYVPYNILEQTIEILDSQIDEFLIEELNQILEQEGSGYRFIKNGFVPVSDNIEVSEIEEAATSQGESSIHIKAAINAISKKENPDYRNCIKESISAVEATARQLTGGTTNLRKALNRLEKNGVTINARLKDSMGKLYDYTNDKDTGIRHCLMTRENPPKYEEAKYMLVVCCAFVNLLKGWNLKSSQQNNG